MVAAVWRLVAGAAAAVSLGSEALAAECPPQDPAGPTLAIKALYAALEAGDEAGLAEVMVPGFYAFEGGKRMTRAELLSLIRGAQASGSVYRWTVNEPDVHMACDVAWLAYVNRGSITKAGTTTPITWLESVGAAFQGGRWRVLFLNSTRAPAS